MRTLLTLAVALCTMIVVAQPQKRSVVIGSKTNRPNALLIVNPPNSDQGVLLPQLSTEQRILLKPSSPSENGLIVFDTTQKTYFYWSDGKWLRLAGENPVRTSFYSIDPLNFIGLKPDNSIHYNNVIVFESDNTFLTAGRNGEGEEVIAPVNLPHGALMEELTVFYLDNDENNLRIYLMRKSFSGMTEQIISWESSGSSSSVRSQSFNDFRASGTIDLENYTYRLLVVFDIKEGEDIDTPSEAQQRLYGVRIKFQE